MKRYFLLFLAMGLVLVSCDKDDPVVDPDSENPVDDPIEETKSRADYPVQDFMWQAMNFYYFYQNNVPNLSDTKFATLDEYVNFISQDANPEDFFFNRLVYSQDRFSFLNEDYKVLTQGFSGVSKSNGLEFGLARYQNTDIIYGFVRYVVANSDASTKDIQRGDLFTAVDGVQLYYNSDTDNNLDLLFGDKDTYTLSLVDFTGGQFVANGREITLTKQEGLVENPILLTKTFDVAGKKVGYMVYNQFAGNSGEPLNDAFGEFQAVGVSELVLDLRYNPGGFGYITQILGSLIHEANPNKLFYNRRYNVKFEEARNVVGGEKTNFVANTGTQDGNSEIPLNSLNLGKVYILATGSSASASELLINGLEPYVDVVHIGSKTVGKNQGSFTFVDSPQTGFFYDPNREDEINPDNQWAIQPITSQVENSEGFGDYADGLIPDIPIDEDFTNLGELGDPTERLLARALQEINGAAAKKDFSTQNPVYLISSSSLQKAGGGKLIFREMPR